MIRHLETVSINKPWYRWEEICINAMKQSELGQVKLAELRTSL